MASGLSDASGKVAVCFSSSALLLVYQAGVAEALLQNQRFMARVDVVHGCSGGALVGALMLTGAEGLTKVKAYLESGVAFRGLTLAELWDPARLIPRAVEESGAMPADAFWQLSGRLHVTYSSFDSNEELVRILQASSSFAYEGQGDGLSEATKQMQPWSLVETTGQVPPPSPRDSHSAVICGDSMYLFGGSTGSARNDLYAFSFETEQWLEVRPTPGASQKANVPCPRFCHTCDVYNNSLYVFGGYDGQQRLNDFWQFKLATEVNIDIPNSSLVSDLRDFLNDAKLSDVTFIVEGKAVYAHKLLCMRCSYFRAMFDGQMREAQQKTITINNVSHRVFLALLEYLYTDEFEISMEIAMDLFVAADQFGIERLKRLCEKKILVSINIDSAATILQAANMHIANDLRQSCMDFILRNFDAVSKTPAFEEMGRSNVELVFEILKRR
eukprot:s33_g92.t3